MKDAERIKKLEQAKKLICEADFGLYDECKTCKDLILSGSVDMFEAQILISKAIDHLKKRSDQL